MHQEPSKLLSHRPPWRPGTLLGASFVLHAVAAVALVLRPDRWRTVAGWLVADHALLCLAGVLPRSKLLGKNLDRCPGVAANEVVLTFDDGPDPRVTPRVLELLEAHGARASFFVIGRRAERHPEIIEAMLRRGHGIENHTYHHRHDFAFRWYRGLAREIDRAQGVLETLTGRSPRYFRAPAGMRNPFLDAVLHHRGLQLVSWTHRGLDAVDGNPDRIVRRLTADIRGGDILLLHDGNSPRDRRGCPVVLETLPRILDHLATRGLVGVPLPSPPEEPAEHACESSR